MVWLLLFYIVGLSATSWTNLFGKTFRACESIPILIRKERTREFTTVSLPVCDWQPAISTLDQTFGTKLELENVGFWLLTCGAAKPLECSRVSKLQSASQFQQNQQYEFGPLCGVNAIAGPCIVHEDGCQWITSNASRYLSPRIQLVDEHFDLLEKNLQRVLTILRRFDQWIIIGPVGRFQSGKSTLQDHIIVLFVPNATSLFPIGFGHESKTKGCWIRIVAISGTTALIFLDGEGTGHKDDEGAEKLSAFIALLSDHLVVQVAGTLTSQDLSLLDVVSTVISDRSEMRGTIHIANFAGTLTCNGQPCSEKEYLNGWLVHHPTLAQLATLVLKVSIAPNSKETRKVLQTPDWNQLQMADPDFTKVYFQAVCHIVTEALKRPAGKVRSLELFEQFIRAMFSAVKQSITGSYAQFWWNSAQAIADRHIQEWTQQFAQGYQQLALKTSNLHVDQSQVIALGEVLSTKESERYENSMAQIPRIYHPVGQFSSAIEKRVAKIPSLHELVSRRVQELGKMVPCSDGTLEPLLNETIVSNDRCETGCGGSCSIQVDISPFRKRQGQKVVQAAMSWTIQNLVHVGEWVQNWNVSMTNNEKQTKSESCSGAKCAWQTNVADPATGIVTHSYHLKGIKHCVNIRLKDASATPYIQKMCKESPQASDLETPDFFRSAVLKFFKPLDGNFTRNETTAAPNPCLGGQKLSP